MLVVESIKMIIIVKKCSFKEHYEKFGTFSVTNGYKKTLEFKDVIKCVIKFIFQNLKLKIFRFFIIVMEFCTFSWIRSYMIGSSKKCKNLVSISFQSECHECFVCNEKPEKSLFS